MIRNYLKIAIRNLFKNKVYSVINVVGLSIGLAAAMLILLYTKDELSYDRFHANNPNIYHIVTDWYIPNGSLKQHDSNTGDFQGPKFKAQIPEIESFVRYQSDNKDVRALGEIKSYEMMFADSNFFSMFTFPMLSGNPKTALTKPNSIVLSEEMARKFFNSTDILGKTLELKSGEKFEPYEVTGVTAKCPQNSSIKFDFLLPKIVDANSYSDNENWFNFFQNTFVLLHPQANVAQVVAKMQQVYEADAAEAINMMAKKYDVKERAKYGFQRFTDMHLSTDYTANNGLVDASNPTYGYILSGIALFILLIACINFINLTVARSLKRAKEIGVRKVIGSNRKQLIWQFMGESFLLSFIAFILAIFLVLLVLPIFNQLANKALAISYLFDTKLVLGYILIFILTALLSGFYPALILSGYNPIQTLYGRFNLSGKSYLQQSLVVLQFGLASFLIIATLSIYSQFDFLVSKDLGYDDTNVIMVDIGSRINKSKAAVFRDQLLQNPNILQVAPKNSGFWGTIAKLNSENEIKFAYETVDENYLPLYKIPLVAGRNFSKDFPADSAKSVIVNEAFVKEAKWKNPIGQVVNFFYNNEKYQVVGVVKDYHFSSITQKIQPQLFTMKSNGFGMVNIKIKPNTETASLAHIEQTFKKLFPINPYTYKFKDLENQKQYEAEAKWKQIMLFGAILTIFISCIGLFGLATLSTERRTKEIGIRKVLGASVSSITTLLSKDFVILVAISFIFSFPIAYYAVDKWLQDYPYRISFGVPYFIVTATITLSIAILTVSFQSIRAAFMNPVKSLKTE